MLTNELLNIAVI